MPFLELKAAAMAILIADGAGSEAIRLYSGAFDRGSADPGARQWPCPQCFQAGMFSLLEPLPQGGLTTLRCVTCREVLEGRLKVP